VVHVDQAFQVNLLELHAGRRVLGVGHADVARELAVDVGVIEHGLDIAGWVLHDVLESGGIGTVVG